MKKWFCFIAMIFLVLQVPAIGQTLQGGIVYTVETAREEAFRGIQYKISMEPYKNLMVDPGFTPAKKEGGKPHVKKWGRWVTFFSDGGYCVEAIDNLSIAYCYNPMGKLANIELSDSDTYPQLSRMYNTKGNLYAVVFRPGNNEQFIYDKNKNLLEYWKKNTGYDLEGKKIGYRSKKFIENRK